MLVIVLFTAGVPYISIHIYTPPKMSETQGKPIKCRAAVTWEPNAPFSIEEIEVAPPKAHEVRIKITHTSICRSDLAGMTKFMPTSKFPIILGHEGSGIVESVGEGVTNVQPGDHVIPLYMSQCNECASCKSNKTNMCDVDTIPEMPGMQVFISMMADKTTRFTCKGQTVYHFLHASTFSEYTVCPDINVAKINPEAPLEKVCLLGCGIPTGYGAAKNTAKVTSGSTCAVWGLGAVGLATVMGCKNAGASRIIGIDIDSSKFEIAKKFGMTEGLNPKDFDKPIQNVLIEMTGGGLDYTFECIGNVDAIRAALEAVHKGWGVAVVIGITVGKEVSFKPYHLISGKKWTGSMFGEWRGRDDVPKLVEAYMKKEIMVDEFISHTMKIDQINEAFDLLRTGKCIRTVMTF